MAKSSVTKWILTAIALVALAVCVYCAAHIVKVRQDYARERQEAEAVAREYTRPVTDPTSGDRSSSGEPAPGGNSGSDSTGSEDPASYAPIIVDFDALKEVNPDVFAWIYCEGTVINYPVVHGRDNQYYLHRSFDGTYRFAGTIFSDASNTPGIVDSNIILYGHHMKDGTMFADLKYWLDPDFFREHPCMWLMTPDGDYLIELFSAYTTQATSETYTIFLGPSAQFDAYLAKVARRSPVAMDATLDSDAHYVVLSTCTEATGLTRTVLHGKLVPVG